MKKLLTILSLILMFLNFSFDGHADLRPILESKNGIYTATVVSTSDPEGRYRVKIKIPLLRNKIIWAEVLKRSTLYFPDVGKTVVISFLDGNMQRPIVIGTID